MKGFHLVLVRIGARATLATIALSISTTQISGSVMLVTASVLFRYKASGLHFECATSILGGYLVNISGQALTDQSHYFYH